MQEIVIASAVRTPIGSFSGALGQMPASDLGALVIKEAIQRAGIDPEQVDEVILGNVLQGGQGQNPARQAAIKAGLKNEVPSWTLNKLCGSGLKSVITAVQAILAEDAEIIVAGGMESMSTAPYVLPKARQGFRMGNGEIIDSMVYDGLTDAFHGIHMGMTAENVAKLYGITREAQDKYALQSQNRAEAAIRSGKFTEEIVPVLIPQRKGEPVRFEQDEFPRLGLTYDALAKLRPAFQKEGTVTAGNASGINDGAAAFVIMSKAKALELGIEPLATIKSWASAGVDPKLMGTGPIPASRKALEKAGLRVEDMDLVEANEAFAAQALAVIQELGLLPEKTNVNGGAIALGHPIGASGARILVTLLHEMKRQNVKRGLATLCIGGGQGIAMVVEK